jgi:hypothetical protein
VTEKKKRKITFDEGKLLKLIILKTFSKTFIHGEQGAYRATMWCCI